jgi:hypothetical protein
MEDPNESNVRALQTAVNLAREAIAEREASDNPEDQEMLDGYRADVERAQAALDRMAAPETVALAAGPVGAAHIAHVMASAHAAGPPLGFPVSALPVSAQGPMAMFADRALGDRSPFRDQGEGTGEDTRGPSNRAARRKRERDAKRAAKVSNASKRTGKP